MDKEYELYGDEWKAEVMQMEKEEIVEIFRKAMMRKEKELMDADSTIIALGKKLNERS